MTHTTSMRALTSALCCILILSNIVYAQEKEHAPRRNLDSKTTRLYLVHMIFMILAWLLFAPAAILLARFARRTTSFRWYPHHRNLNILTVIFVIIGFATAVAAMMERGSRQWENSHHKVGLAIFILVFIQSAMGLAAHRIRARPAGHRYMGYIHAPIGLLLFGLAVWNIETGFDLWAWEAGMAPKIFVYVWMGVLVALYGIGLLFIPKEIKLDRAKKNEEKIKDESGRTSTSSSMTLAVPQDQMQGQIKAKQQGGQADLEKQNTG